MDKYVAKVITFMIFLALTCSSSTVLAQQVDDTAGSISITFPANNAVVGGANIRILHQVKTAENVTICEIHTQITETGDPALSISLSNEYMDEADIAAANHPVIWNSLPMHNGPNQIISSAILKKGDKYITVKSAPITVTVKNLWISASSPNNAFFTLKLHETKRISVDFDHYQAKGPYRVEYMLRMPMNETVLRIIVHENVIGHHDHLDISADKETLPFGAYLCFDIKVSYQGDEATLVSPNCKGVNDNFSLLADLATIKLVYTLSEPPGGSGLTILCYSDLELITAVEGLSEQCRDWANPVIVDLDINKYDSFRTVFVGWDNNKNNRGRSSQPIRPWS